MGGLEKEVTILKLNGTFKVTLRIPELGVSETRLFQDKEDALLQVKEWTD